MTTRKSAAASKRKRKPADPLKMKGDTGWFTHDRFGMFIHWGTYAQAARHEWVKKNEAIRDEDYQVYFDTFDPDLYDPKAWARAAREAGMKYFVITAKHHEGFCLWDSKYTDYKAPNTPAGRDLLRPMVEAFRAEGLRVGFYYSLIDWHHPEFPVDRIHPRSGDAEYRAANTHRDVRKYADYMYHQVEELLTGFGKVDILWFDFSYPGEDGKGREDWQSERLVKMIRKLQPDIILDNRLDLPGVGDIQTPEQFTPSECLRDENGAPAVWEGCQTFSGSWGYHRDEGTWKTVPMLVEMLVNHVCRGGNLLLNVGPTGRGEFDARALRSLAGMGEWMKRHERSIRGCTFAPEGLVEPRDCRYTYNPTTNRLYLHLFCWPFKHVHLPGLAGKVRYAQLLNDASEIRRREAAANVHAGLNELSPSNALTLELPIIRPDVAVPVIEMFLR